MLIGRAVDWRKGSFKAYLEGWKGPELTLGGARGALQEIIIVPRNPASPQFRAIL
jgi:hypothetical protein